MSEQATLGQTVKEYREALKMSVDERLTKWASRPGISIRSKSAKASRGLMLFLGL